MSSIYWMRREYPDILFERYADDAICHCRSEAQALELRQALEKRFADCKLQLHPQKTKVVYCKDANRPGHFPEQSFDFLGYTFRPRLASNRHGERFVAFIPAVSKQAGKKMRLSVRRWRMHRRNDLELAQIAAWVRPVLTGWVRYFGRFYPSKLQEELRTIDALSFAGPFVNTSGSEDIPWPSGTGCARSTGATRPCLPTGAWDQRSDAATRMNREVHVRF